MTDIAGWTYQAAAQRSLFAVVGSAALGVVSGLGPCSLARCMAMTAMTGGASRRNVAFAVSAYAVGAAVGYVAYGTIAGVAFRVAAWSSYSYAVLAAVLACTGIASLVRAPVHAHEPRVAPIGGATLLGLGASLTLSPCCAPFVVALTGILFGDLGFASLLLCGFTIGHVAPAAAMAAMASVGRKLVTVRPSVVAFVTGTVSLAMAGYYGLLV